MPPRRTDTSMFTWLECTKPRRDGHERRTKVATNELASRAGLLFRLGFSLAEATQWLCAQVAWEFDPSAKKGAHRRPDALSDQAVAKIVTETYARRPA